jgi:hypothetical protein
MRGDGKEGEGTKKEKERGSKVLILPTTNPGYATAKEQGSAGMC